MTPKYTPFARAKGLLFGVTLLVCYANFLPSNAQQVGQILSQVDLGIQIEPQQTLEWCWVASARMIATHYNRRVPPQCDMLQQQYGAPCCSNPALCTVPGSIWQVQQLIGSFGLRYSQVSRPASPNEMLALFNQGHPIVIHLVQGHFVVASGMKMVVTPVGTLGIVHILDPFYGVQDISLPNLYSMWDAGLYVQ